MQSDAVMITIQLPRVTRTKNNLIDDIAVDVRVLCGNWIVCSYTVLIRHRSCATVCSNDSIDDIQTDMLMCADSLSVRE